MKTIMHSRWLIVGALLVNAACWPLQAGADEVAQATTKEIVGNTAGNTTRSAADIFGSAAVDTENLAISRGGAEVNLFDVKSEGLVSNNSASNLSTGSNWVTEGSFAGASGFSTVVQNSGNNVLIQNATVINLQVK